MKSVVDNRFMPGIAGLDRHRTSWLTVLVALVSLFVVACSSDEGESGPSGTSEPTAAATSTSPDATPDSTAVPGTEPDPTGVPSSTATSVSPTSEPDSNTPTPSATGVPTTTIPDPPIPTEEPLTKAEQLAVISEQVSRIRELSVVGDPNVSLVDKERIAQELAEDLDDEEVLAEVAELEVWFKLLGLIPQDSSLLEIETALLEGAVVGLYNHDTGELMVLGGGEDVSVKEEAVYSHEYAHLLQDVNFDLSELFESAKVDTERTSALQAFVEGEATFIESFYALENFEAADLDELIAIDPADLAVLEATPDFLILTLSWPYTAGFAFTNSIWVDGGMAALNATWGDLPETTEQVIHPEKYLAKEVPVGPLILPDLTAILGDGWAVHSADVFGEAIISLWLESLGAETAVAAQAGAGWGRDAYTVLTGPSGASAMGLVIEWDDPGTDALQFSAVLEAVLDADAAFTRLESGDVTISLWDGPGGTLAFALDGSTGAAGVAVAPTLQQATALLSALVDA
ncbi:MAG: hypothetical protein HOC77_09785 [Chloroflexi bacterium]|nr:hypothetical protein [Chloroflexota bacterium]MBT4073614.1 hypothetical protein [Chloroflexota bacterium]MBT4515365.1 hypothetical protein [Chloroflexota bacterium]MBT6682650.1 hypothetical protein [Chloroflexota bacterium]